MAYASDIYLGDGTTRQYNVTFPYIARAHVQVRVGGVLMTEGDDYVWLASSVIEFVIAPTLGVIINFKRQTSPDARLIDYQAGSNLTNTDLNTDSLQDFYLAQEAQDTVSNTIVLDDADDKFEGLNKVIKNVAPGVASTDAVNKAQLDAIIPPPTNFTDLGDAPSGYLGAANKSVRVKADESGLEFVTPSSTPTLLALPDTPDSYTGQASKNVTVKADESGVEFTAPPATPSFLALPDTPDGYTGHASKNVKVKSDESGLEFVTPPASPSFLTLPDTPDNYSGQASKNVKVKADETGLEFVDPPATPSLLALTDTPDNYVGQALKNVRVKADETGVEFSAPPATPSLLALPDTPDSYTGQSLKTVRVKADETGVEFAAPASAPAFTALPDVPDSYVGQASKLVSVKGDETGVEFVDPAGATATFVALTDVPDSYTGQASKLVSVKTDETGVEFVTPTPPGASAFTELSDVPSSFFGHGGKTVKVKTDQSGLEFVSVAGGGGGGGTLNLNIVDDFGAVGNGVADDGPAFNDALLFAWQNGATIDVPALTYKIITPILVTITSPIGVKWGLRGMGGKMVSGLGAGQTLLKVDSQSIARYLEISGLSFTGNGTEQDGICLRANTSSQFLWNCSLLNITVEGFGRHGLFVEGDVFESLIQNSYFQDNLYNGAYFTNTSAGGICSAWTIIACNFSQNGNAGVGHGLESRGPSDFDAPTDFRIYGGYCRNNEEEGFKFWNGLSPGCAIDQVGFENNCESLAVGSSSGAHVSMGTRGTLRNCTGHVMDKGSTYLVKGFIVDRATLINCSMSDAGAASGLSKLCNVEGSGAFWHLIDCSGNFTSNGTNTWRADYCDGVQPDTTTMDRTTSYTGT